MDKAVLEAIAQRISNKKVDPNFIFLGKDGYESEPLDNANYHQIAEPESTTVAFVDGGNAELASGSNFSLQFIRTCAVIVQDKKRVRVERQECFCLVQAAQKDGSLKYTVELFGLNDLSVPAIDLYETSLSEGHKRVEPARVAELVRVLAEHKQATKVIENLPNNSFLVRDGDLKAHTLYEQNALREVFEKARMQGVTVAGLSKTTNMLTDTGHSAIPILLNMAQDLKWYYYPIATSTRQDHQACVAVAKLHPSSLHAFRVDLWDQQEPLLGQLMAVLASQSQDAAFLGYPYGLIEADRFAKVREEEKSYLRIRSELVLGSALKQELLSRDGHDHLNKAV